MVERFILFLFIVLSVCGFILNFLVVFGVAVLFGQKWSWDSMFHWGWKGAGVSALYWS